MKHALLMLALGAAAPVPWLSAQTVLQRFQGQRTGEQLGAALGKVGDLDGDGAPELIVGGSELARVYSGRTGALLRALTPVLAGEGFGAAVEGISDVTGDAVPDLLVGAPVGDHGTGTGAVYVFSGATGNLSRTVLLAGSVRLGGDLAVLGDVNGDGVADFVAADRVPRRLTCFSGQSGGVLYQVASGSNNAEYANTVRQAGDVNRDGVVDFIAGDAGPARVSVHSGRDGAVLRQLPPPPGFGRFGAGVGPAGDVDADGWPDLVVGAPEDASFPNDGAAYVISGQTGQVLRRLLLPLDLAPGNEELGRKVTGIGDLNQDGFADVAASSLFFRTYGAARERVFVFSGRDGAVLMDRPTDSAGGWFEGLAGPLRETGDLNLDGTPDFAIGLPYDSPMLLQSGLVLVVSGLPFASTTVVGDSCGAGPFLPNLRSTRPILGQTATLAGEYAPRGAAGVVLWSAVPPWPLDLNGGCFLQLDVLSILPLLAVPNAGTWSMPLPLPADRAFAGLPLRLQALFFPTAGFLGFDLTNGLGWRLGY
jgi:hypothetical protein